jgi:pantoate--beta-alanine ligase
MQIVTRVAAMQRRARTWQQERLSVALVPTMGYLHAGHVSLVRRARQFVGKAGKVVVSVYVNPTQFGPKEDFNQYPRDLARDLRLCRIEGVDVVFTPDNAQMYAGSDAEPFSTYVVEEQLSQGMEGASRPGHFRGVTTVVAKLFNIVQPNFAVFGAKDFQQAAVIKRMVRDLNFQVKIVVAPTLRESDGLAMSSRNKYLQGDLRTQALILRAALLKVQFQVRNGSGPIAAGPLKTRLKRLIESQPAARLDYVEFFDPRTLRPVKTVVRGSHMALAVVVGKTRLIDNSLL